MLRLSDFRPSSVLRFSPILVALAVVGCAEADGPPRESVGGQVTLDGKPLEKGFITFIPDAGGELVVSALVVDGEFSIARSEGPGLGSHRVEVWSKKATGKVLKDRNDPENPIQEMVEAVPPRYNLRTELKADVVQGGDNQFTFGLDGSKAPVRKIASRRS